MGRSAPATLPKTSVAAPHYRLTWLMSLPFPLRTMLRRWLSLIGMMVGVGIALSITLTILGVNTGSMNLFTADFRRSGADLYLVTQGGTLIAYLPGDTPGTIKDARRVLAQIRALPDTRAAVAVMNWSMEREQPGPRRRDQPAELIATMGVDGDPLAVPEMLVIQEGRWLRRSEEIVIGPKLSREKSLPVGSQLRLNGRDFTVVGIGKLRGFGLGTDTLAYMDYTAFRERAGISDVVNIVAIDTDQLQRLRDRLPDIAPLAASTPTELVKRAEEVNAASVVVNWIFSLLALSIGALFVSNVLSRSVIERRLQFATLRAIGVPNRTILLVVATEAVIVSLVASLIGVIISAIFGFMINAYLAPIYGIESLYSAAIGDFLLVFVLALMLGLIAGFMPARRATQVDPVDILREA